MRDASLTDRVVVITGASSGFGKGMAREFSREGARLALAARRDELLEEVAREASAGGHPAFAQPTDVSIREEVQELADQTIGRFGRIDVWVNNAGVGAIGRFEEIPLEVHEQVVLTDLVGTLYGSYVAWKQFLAQGDGVLINISSELGMHTVPYYTSYTAAKHGVVGLCQSLRQELSQNGHDHVHVCLVMPTAHDTPFFDHVANYSGHEVQAPDPLHDPMEVIEAVIGLAKNPKDEKIVGRDGIAKVLLKRLAPGVAEKIGAKQMHKVQIEQSGPAPDTAGAVEAPMDKGTRVTAGRRQEKKEEKKRS